MYSESAKSFYIEKYYVLIINSLKINFKKIYNLLLNKKPTNELITLIGLIFL